MEHENDAEGETLLKKYTEQDVDSDSDNSILHFTQIELEERHLNQPVVSPQLSPSSSSCSSCYLLLAAIMASLGGVLFGYDIGIISGAVLQLRECFCLSCFQQEFVISAMLVGAMVGSLSGGFFIDKCGRRLTIILNAVVFLVGALVLSLSQSYSLLLIGRVIVGFAVSVSATGECIYISEIAPARKRGLLVSLNELGITLGLLLAYLVNFMFIEVYEGWRFMFGLSAVPAVIQGTGMIFLPKSPRYLMLIKQEQKAEEVLFKLRGRSVEKEISSIKVSLASEMNHSCTDLCSSRDNMRSRLFIGAGLVFFQQFTGQPNVLYYAPTIFEAVGFESHFASTLATVGLGVVKVIMTIVALACVDKWGRRKFLLTGATLMGIAILCLGLVTHFDNQEAKSGPCSETLSCSLTQTPESQVQQIYLPLNYTQVATPATSVPHINTSSSLTSVTVLTDSLYLTNYTGGGSTFNTSSVKAPVLLHGSTAGKVTAFIALMLYVAAFAVSFGPVTWLVLSEIFPASIKGRAIGFATVLNWGTNLLVSFFFLDVIDYLGVSMTFYLFSVICVVSVVFIFVFVPETKGRSLEQISIDLKKRGPMSGVKIRVGTLWCCKHLKTEVTPPSYKPVTEVPMTTLAVG